MVEEDESECRVIDEGIGPIEGGISIADGPAVAAGAEVGDVVFLTCGVSATRVWANMIRG